MVGRELKAKLQVAGYGPVATPDVEPMVQSEQVLQPPQRFRKML
jgi:hypothetical protein